ncbi:MAG: M20/M25/M40 family metallo-hydrolase [Eggerthellaceae bacterium]|jgi:tripeptide aminopeptidase
MSEERLLKLFLDLVRIDSPSRFEAAVAKRCQAELESLGFSVHFDNALDKTESNTGNLIAYLPGTRDGEIVLSSHMDTVNPGCGVEPLIENGIIRSAGDTVLGGDDKAGIASILEGIRRVLESGDAYPSMTVIFSTCEELSLLGARNLEAGAVPQGAPCYVFDADGHPGTIIYKAPCHCTLQATFHGRASHAGVAPEKGVSAIEMASKAISAMRLGRLDDETTANIGVIEGGRETNVVADLCVIKGECRSFNEEKARQCREAMSEACLGAAESFGGTVELAWNLDYHAISYEKSDPFIQKIMSAVESIGLEPVLASSGGGADANVYCSHGLLAITLGIGMTNYHSVDEYISVKDLADSASLVEALIRLS